MNFILKALQIKPEPEYFANLVIQDMRNDKVLWEFKYDQSNPLRTGKDDRMLAGLTVARERGMTAPEGPAESPLIALAQKTEG